MVVVQHDDGFVRVLLGVHDGARDPECFGQELQGVLGVLDDPVPQLPDPLCEGGVLRGPWFDAPFERGLDVVEDLRRRRRRLVLVFVFVGLRLFINRFRFVGTPVRVGYASGMTVYKFSDKPVPMMRAVAAPARLFDNEPRSSGVPVRIPLVVPEAASG